jgi:death on curing protein
MKIIYLTLEQILAIHYDQIEGYGGSHGIRDLPLLESAIERPQASFMGEDLYPDVFTKAAALMHSMALNHPFLDGNKRTATVSTAAFLHFNGWDIKVNQDELIEISLNVESKKWDQEALVNWLKSNCQKVNI